MRLHLHGRPGEELTGQVVLAEGVLDLDGATERCDDPLGVLQAFGLGAARHRDPPPPLGPSEGRVGQAAEFLFDPQGQVPLLLQRRRRVHLVLDFVVVGL